MNKPNAPTPIKSGTTSAAPVVPKPVSQQGPNNQAKSDPKPVAGRWELQISAAKVAWNKLTETELIKSEGQEQKLSGLVKERYAVSHDEANKQVKAFLQKHPA